LDARAFFVAFYMLQTLQVFKQANGQDRWVLQSSSGFRDQDREIVSTKSLEADVERADADGDYGPLLWWHVKGLTLGDCDFNAMHGRVLIESGTFRHPTFSQMAKEHADELGVSIGFKHPENEPDADGVFHTIRRKERSLLPRDRASNLLTSVVVVPKESTMTKNKVDKLKQLVGDPAVVDGLIAGAEQAEKAAAEAGLAFKETQTLTTPAEAPAGASITAQVTVPTVDAPSAPATLTVAETKSKTPDSPAADEMDPNDEAEDAAEGTEGSEGSEDKGNGKPKTKSRVKTVGNMSADEFADRLGFAFKEATAGLQAALTSVVESAKAATAQIASLKKTVEEQDVRIKELEGEQPKLKNGFVPSRDGDISGALKEALKETVKAQPNAIDGLVDFMLGAKK